jgi:hypothetical protein
LGVWGFKALMYLWRKVVCLFVFFSHTYEIHQTGMLQIVFLVYLESSQGEGVHWLGSRVCLDLWCKSSWILNDFFPWKLN